MNQKWQKMLAILHQDVIPATGCTEPISLAYAAAVAARDLQGEEITSIEAFVSSNLMKNGMGVTVPGTGIKGLPIAAAVGSLGGDPEGGLQVLSALTPDVVEKGKQMLANGQVSVEVANVPYVLYSEVNVHSANHHSRVCIANAHTNIIHHECDGQVISHQEVGSAVEIGEKEKFLQTLTAREVFDFAMDVPLDEIAFLKEAATLNDKLAEEGLTGNYGLALGACMKDNVENGLLSDDMMNQIVTITTAASDARMGGAPFPAMTNSGSGNQGIAATEPVTVLARYKKVDEETLIRALALSHMMAVYIHGYLPKLSALCAVSTAAMGSAAGMAWLLGKSFQVVEHALCTMTGDLMGMICDGAANSCAAKVSTASSSAVRAALLAQSGRKIMGTDGLVADDVDDSLRNIGQLACVGMKQTDVEILNIMLKKK